VRVGNVTGVSSLRRLGLSTGVVLGVVALALLVLLAVFLPKAEGSTTVSLPDGLPGGLTALDSDRSYPQDVPDGFAEQQGAMIRSTVGSYGDVYDEPVAFRIYADADVQVGVGVTVFAGDGGSFGPEFGISSGTEMSRQGDAVCQAVFQQDQMGGQSDTPALVTCQLPDGAGHTVQVAAQGLDVDQTVDLAHDVADAI
jgi:hypothetical protein